MNSGYDPGTKIWTTVLGFAIAAVIDWAAVVNPARGAHPDPPFTEWWTFGLVAVCIAPASWLMGRLTARDNVGSALWVAVLAAVALAHFIPLTWAQSQS